MTEDHNPQRCPSHRRDGGFTLVEILIVVVILGVLAAVTVLAVRGTTEQAETNTCGSEKRMLESGAQAYLVEAEGSVVPATGTGDDRFEQTLVDAGIITRPSTNLNLDAAGDALPTPGGMCE